MVVLAGWQVLRLRALRCAQDDGVKQDKSDGKGQCGAFPFGKPRVRMTAKTSNSKGNGKSFG